MSLSLSRFVLERTGDVFFRIFACTATSSRGKSCARARAHTLIIFTAHRPSVVAVDDGEKAIARVTVVVSFSFLFVCVEWWQWIESSVTNSGSGLMPINFEYGRNCVLYCVSLLHAQRCHRRLYFASSPRANLLRTFN